MSTSTRLIGLSLLAVLPACSWDFQKLPVRDFRQNLCDVIDNFQKNAQDNASRIQDSARRDAAYRDINNKLTQLAAAKLSAVNAYTNCNEAQLKAAQAIAESIVKGITDVAGNMANPVKRVSSNVRGSKSAGPGVKQMQVVPGSQVRLAAAATPTDPLDVHGMVVADFQPTSAGYRGPVVDLQWQVELPGQAIWAVMLTPASSNEFRLDLQSTGGYVGDLHVHVTVDGPGVTRPLVLDLPLTMDASETQWAIDTAGMVPADPFFPLAPPADIRFGQGCIGGLASEPHLEPSSVVRVGDPLTVRVDEGPVGGFSTLIVGINRTQVDLSFLFGPGCELFVTPDLMLLTPLDPTGSALHTLPLPPDPALAGFDLHLQALVLDPQNGFAGGLTGGLVQTIYPR